MVKFNQDHFWAISSIFHFLAMLSYPPPLANANLTWAGWLTQYGHFQNFLKWPKNLLHEWRKTTCFLGDLNLEAYIMYNVW